MGELVKDEVGEIDLQVEDAFDINFAEHERIASIHAGDDIYEEVESEDDSDEEVSEEEKSNGEDVGHMELAWEVLELAKNISGKHGKIDIKAEASLTAAISVLTARISSHSAEKEGLENIIH